MLASDLTETRGWAEGPGEQTVDALAQVDGAIVLCRDQKGQAGDKN